METKYWIVGAAFHGGNAPQDDDFVKAGIWMLDKAYGNQRGEALKIKAGDMIAIKRLRGKGQKGIKIIYIGIVRGCIPHPVRVICTVNWVDFKLDRVVESKGCFKAIQGPFLKSDATKKAWIEEIFSL